MHGSDGPKDAFAVLIPQIQVENHTQPRRGLSIDKGLAEIIGRK